MAWFLWCVLGGALGECVVSRRVGLSVGWRVAALLAWVVLLVVLLVYSFAGGMLAGRGAVSAVALGFVASVVVGVVLMVCRGVGAAGSRAGLVDWVKENRGRAVALVAVVLVVAAGASFVGFGASSEVAALPLAAEQEPPISATAESSAAGCSCDSGGVCVGPRGGRYCLTAAGGKKYL